VNKLRMSLGFHFAFHALLISSLGSLGAGVMVFVRGGSDAFLIGLTIMRCPPRSICLELKPDAQSLASPLGGPPGHPAYHKNFRANCIMRGVHALLTSPLPMFSGPVQGCPGSVAPLQPALAPSHCGWLKVLNVSQRN
jgi:hypothetical protein